MLLATREQLRDRLDFLRYVSRPPVGLSRLILEQPLYEDRRKILSETRGADEDSLSYEGRHCLASQYQ